MPTWDRASADEPSHHLIAVSARNSDHGTTSKVGRKVGYSSGLDHLLRFGSVRCDKNALAAIRKSLRSILCTPVLPREYRRKVYV